MGSIMCMGVATANSILVVSFSKERLAHHNDAIQAAIEAGFTRFRPVLMTALAMIIGMVPMALGLGEGGEQNAPLGRAVIGGLMFATVATLVFVRLVFSFVARDAAAESCRAGGGIRSDSGASIDNTRGKRNMTVEQHRKNKSNPKPQQNRAGDCGSRNCDAPGPGGGGLDAGVLRHPQPHRVGQYVGRAGPRADSVVSVSVVHPKLGGQDEEVVLPGNTQAFHRLADLRPHQRLSEEVVRRHRDARESRTAPGGNRCSRTRPPVAAGEGRSGYCAGESQARAEPPPSAGPSS